ncbi:MAG: DUF4292 domain-containing protein [Deltaproteobacteria bacterium]|nr:MAG: DUF4292 domain-containing protein [Deltaproteobacteria bacterium]
MLGALQRWQLILFGCIFLFLPACAKKPSALEPADLPASVVVERLEQKRSLLSTFRAVANLKLDSGTHRWSGKAFLLSQIPHSLRLEVLGVLGQPRFYVVSDGSRFLTWEPGRKRAYQGLALDNTLSSIVGLPLKDREALLLLIGIIPPWNYQEARLFRETDTGTFVLLLEDGAAELEHRVWLDAGALAVTKVERLQRNRRQLQVRFADFFAIQDSLYPKSVDIESDGFRLRLHYRQVGVNQPLDPAVFRLVLPEGVEIVPW